jgi:hypothetical protein
VISKCLFLFALCVFAGSSQFSFAATNGASVPAGSSIQGRTPAPGRTLTDAQIERAMKTKMSKSKLSADHFTFSVQNGVVTIEGNTGIIQHKGVMTRMARTSGATVVHNNIRISDEAKAKAAEHLTGRAPAPVPHASVVSPH